MSVITISRQLGSLGTEIAQAVADRGDFLSRQVSHPQDRMR